MDADTLHKVIVAGGLLVIATMIAVVQKIQMFRPLLSFILWIRKKWKRKHEQKDEGIPSPQIKVDDSSIGRQGGIFVAGGNQTIDQSRHIYKINRDSFLEESRKIKPSRSKLVTRTPSKKAQKRKPTRRTSRAKKSIKASTEEPHPESLITQTPINSNVVKSAPNNEEARTTSTSAISEITLQHQRQIHIEFDTTDERIQADAEKELDLVPGDTHVLNGISTLVMPSYPVELSESDDASTPPTTGSDLYIGNRNTIGDISTPTSSLESSATAEESSTTEDTAISTYLDEQSEALIQAAHELSDGLLITPETTISDPSNVVHGGNQPSLLAGDEVFASLLTKTTPQRIGSELQRRRVFLGISQVDISYDVGWVDQMESGYWNTSTLALPRQIELLKRYLRIIGWTFADLQEHLGD
jgi:hypothetical protein